LQVELNIGLQKHKSTSHLQVETWGHRTFASGIEHQSSKQHVNITVASVNRRPHQIKQEVTSNVQVETGGHITFASRIKRLPCMRKEEFSFPCHIYKWNSASDLKQQVTLQVQEEFSCASHIYTVNSATVSNTRVCITFAKGIQLHISHLQ
jgi:hypothetical protein